MVNKNMYFTIDCVTGGFTAQMIQFSAFYTLGRELGYSYIHIPWHCARTAKARDLDSGLEQWSMGVPSFSVRNGDKPKTEIYRFIGLDSYFESEPEVLADVKHIVIDMDEVIDTWTKDRNKSLEDFKIRIRGVCDAQEETFLLVLKFVKSHGSSRLEKLIGSSNADPDNRLDFRKMYFDERKKHHWDLSYPKGKTKILVHMRQGDTALIQAPWGNFLSIWPPYNKYKETPADEFVEFATKNRALTVSCFSSFLEKLAKKNEGLSILGFSDGFELAHRKVTSMLGGFEITAEQKHMLREMASEGNVSSHNERAFSDISRIENCNLVVGEEPEKLCDLVHNFLHADVVIIGRQQSMVCKLIKLYCNDDTMPLLIVLGHGLDPEQFRNYKGFPSDKVMIVDVNRPKYREIFRKMNHLGLLSAGDMAGMNPMNYLRRCKRFVFGTPTVG